MIMSIFADIIIPRGGIVALGSIIEVGALVGISEQAVRSSVNRLIADRLLASSMLGRRAMYRLSDSASKRAPALLQRIYQDDTSESWSGEWQIIVVNSRKLQSEEYAEYAWNLKWLGYGRVGEDVFVRAGTGTSPLCCSNDFGGAITANVVCFVARTVPCMTEGSVRGANHQIWNLDAVADRYADFCDRYTALAVALQKGQVPRAEDDLAIRIFLMHDFRRIRIIDPQLPSSLLPSGWPGKRALDITRQIYSQVLTASEKVIAQVMQGPAGTIPAPEASFFERFGGLSRPV